MNFYIFIYNRNQRISEITYIELISLKIDALLCNAIIITMMASIYCPENNVLCPHQRLAPWLILFFNQIQTCTHLISSHALDALVARARWVGLTRKR